MKALKTFFSSFHFLTLAFFCLITWGLCSGFFCRPTDQTIGTALASIPPGNSGFLSIPIPPSDFDNMIADNHTEIRGKLRAGDTLARSFNRNKVPGKIHNLIVRKFKGLIDFSSLLPGDDYSIIIDENGGLVQCYYESGPFDIYTISKNTDGTYLAEKTRIPLECKIVKISGQVDSTLFTAFAKDIKDPKIIYKFADIFASKMDFNTETRQGDDFNLVVEKYYKYDEFVGFGKILTASYHRTNGDLFEGFYFASEKTPGSYFDRDGNELGTSFLRSPVPMARVSSGFSRHRLHPILGVIKKHLGVDLAAPRGTPIMATADGKVVRIGWNGGFGRQITISHGGDYKTMYGHLSRFKKGLRVGSRVKQKQIIGYVGSTGLATGPHLDYRIQESGVFRNPFAIKFKPKSVLKPSELARLQTTIVRLAALSKSAPIKENILQVRKAAITSDHQFTTL